MKFFPGDYHRATVGLTTEQHGAYLLLLMALWDRDGELPNDPALLTRITGIRPCFFQRLWKAIGHFFEIDGDIIRQKRVSRDLQRVHGDGTSNGTQDPEKSEQFLRARTPSRQNPDTREKALQAFSSGSARARGRAKGARRAPRSPEQPQPQARVLSEAEQQRLDEIDRLSREAGERTIFNGLTYAEWRLTPEGLAHEQAAPNGRLDS